MDEAALGPRLRTAIDQAGEFPLPASGRTLQRWSMLAHAAGRSMPVGKCVESHADALAILAELGAAPVASTEQADSGHATTADRRPAIWAVWAAEIPGLPLQITAADGDGAIGPGMPVVVRGSKAWCSGAGIVTDALMTVKDASGRPWLVHVDMTQSGITHDHSRWVAVGMHDTATATTTFAGVAGTTVGPSGGYLDRPGFWHGAIGVAACWYGGAVTLAEVLRQSATRRHDAHSLAHLGNVDGSLRAARAALREAARWIDDHPTKDAYSVALAVRWQVESTVRTVLRDTGEALGAAPYCMNPDFARMTADLPVFMRQSHARRDAEALGRHAIEAEPPWALD